MLQFISRDLDKDELYFIIDLTLNATKLINVDIIYDELRHGWKELSTPIKENYLLYVKDDETSFYVEIEKSTRNIYFDSLEISYIKLVRKHVI